MIRIDDKKTGAILFKKDAAEKKLEELQVSYEELARQVEELKKLVQQKK